MKVLVIGASGMLARPVINRLYKNGLQLRLFSRSVNADMFPDDHEIVRGDVLDPVSLEMAVKGCDAIHINLANINEADATRTIVSAAQKEKVRMISMISGNTVKEENRWFPMIDDKFRAEQIIINSGIPYMIFRAPWFFESLDLMIRNGKATLIGKKLNPGHWVAAEDYARMVGVAYKDERAQNHIFYVFGPELKSMKELLQQYCEALHPEIKKISTVSTGMLKFIAILSRNAELKKVVGMFRYFEKTKETGDPEETNNLLGKPEITFEKWLMLRG